MQYGLRNRNVPALRIMSRELDLGDIPLETHGRSTLLVLRDWFVVRDGMLDQSCTERVVALVNERLELHFKNGEWDAIRALHYASAILIRGEA